jgi:hypothetical protein
MAKVDGNPVATKKLWHSSPTDGAMTCGSQAV